MRLTITVTFRDDFASRTGVQSLTRDYGHTTLPTYVAECLNEMMERAEEAGAKAHDILDVNIAITDLF